MKVACHFCRGQVEADQAIQIGGVLVCPDCLRDLDEALEAMKQRLGRCPLVAVPAA